VSEQWVTYHWQHHSRNVGEVFITKLSTESKPRHGHESRPATDEEIAAEKSKRTKWEEEYRRELLFKARPEYIAAKAIHDILEWITPVDNPLDAFTVEEWQAIERRLTQCKT
jgi:hypothetical protein